MKINYLLKINVVVIFFALICGLFACDNSSKKSENTPNDLVKQDLPTLFLRGSFNSWSTVAPFKRISAREYQVKADISLGIHEFTLASEDWKEQFTLPQSAFQEIDLINDLDKPILLEQLKSDGKIKLITERPGLYAEQFRPQFHFTPQNNWMNDPNGMVYYQGEYHLFYQYHPESSVWGPMHWGHAISKDLVTWEQYPIALYPDEKGTIFSGSAVVDWHNTSGFGTNNNPPLVAIYTYHNEKLEKQGSDNFQSQAIAYSLDKGRTWHKYAYNPVLTSPGIRDFRDPKVFWHKESAKWIMSLAQKDHVGFYSSTNLLQWQLESTFGKEFGSHSGVWECPDLIKMPIAGTNDSKYVLLVSINPGGPNGGSATQYYVGDFDGRTFTLDNSFEEYVNKKVIDGTAHESAVWLDYGTDNYAGVTFSDVPDKDGRVLFMGWMSNWQYATKVPTEVWRSAMTVPRELSLVNTNSGLRVFSQPVEELNQLIKTTTTHDALPEQQFYNLVTSSHGAGLYKLELDVIPNETSLIKISFVNHDQDSLTLSLNTTEGIIELDRTTSGLVDFDDGFASVQTAYVAKGMKKYNFVIYLDHSSIEVFVNNGESVMTSLLFPTKPYSIINVEADSHFLLKNVVINELSSIWK